MRILLVEDNFLAGIDIAQRLTALGCEVIGPVATQEQAFEILNSEVQAQPDAAILDYGIRGGTSMRIAEVLFSRDCPFVFVTGYSELPENLVGVHRLQKPVDDAELVLAVEMFKRRVKQV